MSFYKLMSIAWAVFWAFWFCFTVYWFAVSGERLADHFAGVVIASGICYSHFLAIGVFKK